MAFERNDIVNKTRLMGELGEELMGYAHNDIVTVDVMEKAIAEGGGGGGGDFTTAQATIYNTGGSGIDVFIASISEGELKTVINIDAGSNVTATIVLYKGTQIVWSPTSDVIEVTGDAEIDDGMAIVSGDCTIKFE